MYVNNDEQRRHVLSAMHSAGSYDEWKHAARIARSSTVARFMLAISFASPLLEMIGERSIPIHVHCKTMSGKTAALKCALAVWGDPKLLMRNFNATAAGLEVLLGTMRNIPVCVDAVREENLNGFSFAEWVYMVGNEHGRTRAIGLTSGTPVETWRTCVITTSEFPVTKANTMDGVNSRLIEISGYPYEEMPESVYAPIIGTHDEIAASVSDVPEQDDDSNGADMSRAAVLTYKKIAEWTHGIVENNYGYAGKEYIAKLIEEVLAREDVTVSASNEGEDVAARTVPFIRHEYERMKADVCAKCRARLGREPEHEIGVAVGALADYYSSLFVFHMEDTKEAWNHAVDMAVSVHDLLKDDEKQAIVDQAWGFLNDWVATNAGSFLDEEKNSTDIPRPLYGSTKDELVYAIVASVNKALDDNGFPHGKCIQGFKERGYIELFQGTGKKDNTVVRTSTSRSFGGFRGRVYVFKIPDSFYDIPEAERTPLEEES